MPRPRLPQATTSIYDAHNDLNTLRDNVERSATSSGRTLTQIVKATHEKLAHARSAIKDLQNSLRSPGQSPVQLEVSKSNSSNSVSVMLSPLREVAQVLNAIAEVHPVTKAIAEIVTVVVEMELRRRKNDMNIAVTFYEMSICVLVLADLDRVYTEGEAPENFLTAFEVHLEGIVATIKEFGGFCEMYYKRNTLTRMCRSTTYKDKLTGYVDAFDKYKRGLHMDISTHASLKTVDIDVKLDTLVIDVIEIKDLLRVKSAKEQDITEYIDAQGGLDAVLEDEPKMKQLTAKVEEKIDANTLKMLKEDVDRTLARHMNRNELFFQYTCERLETSVSRSFEDALDRKMAREEGAHQFIEDEDIRDVWQKMKAGTSVNSRIFINALQEHFLFEAVKYEAQHGEKSPNRWALHFLSKMIFYPAIGDALDEDLSGFISPNEVNNFLSSRPPKLGCNSIQWIAFWGYGPYKTNFELVREIEVILGIISKASVRPEHTRRMQYLRGVIQRLGMISVQADIVGCLGESEATKSNYAAFEEVRKSWKMLEMQRIDCNLNLVDYTLPGAEAIALVLGNRRIEHYVIFLIHALLRRQLEVINFARHDTVSVHEFIDMRESWEWLFRIFDERLVLLLKIWRQHRLDPESHVQTYAGGLFENWYHFRNAMMESSTCDNGYPIKDGKEGITHRNQNHLRRISKFTEEIDLSPQIDAEQRSSSPTYLTNRSILNYPQPKVCDDDSGLVIEDELVWERRDVIERKEKAELKKRLDKMEAKLDQLLGYLEPDSAPGHYHIPLRNTIRLGEVAQPEFNANSPTHVVQASPKSPYGQPAQSSSPINYDHRRADPAAPPYSLPSSLSVANADRGQTHQEGTTPSSPLGQDSAFPFPPTREGYPEPGSSTIQIPSTRAETTQHLSPSSPAGSSSYNPTYLSLPAPLSNTTRYWFWPPSRALAQDDTGHTTPSDSPEPSSSQPGNAPARRPSSLGLLGEQFRNVIRRQT